MTLLRNVMLTVPRELGLPVVHMVADDLVQGRVVRKPVNVNTGLNVN